MGRNGLLGDGGVTVILSEVIASPREAITQSKDPWIFLYGIPPATN